MSALEDLQLHRIIHARFDIAQLFADLRERSQNIKLRDGCRCFLDRLDIVLYKISDTEEKFILQLIDLRLGVQHQIFHLFQFRRDETFRIGQSLFSYVVFGDQIKIGLGHFQIIAEDPIVPDFQVFDAGPLAFGVFEIGYPLLSVFDGKVQIVQLFRKAGLDQTALFDGERRLFTDRAVDHIVNFRQAVNIVVDLPQRGSLHRAEIRFDLRQHRDRIAQGDEISAVGIAAGNAPGQTLKIINTFQVFLDIVPREKIVV